MNIFLQSLTLENSAALKALNNSWPDIFKPRSGKVERGIQNLFQEITSYNP